ncbi:MAG: aminotransferase class I/II-fold pyridoxal phosphate-dependent enzyme [Bacteroidetes bacterium]|nr:aminotransferase class I/II-fold pyridoxal phosphate-dependent enzyme [Bacteroidota bacterium]
MSSAASLAALAAVNASTTATITAATAASRAEPPPTPSHPRVWLSSPHLSGLEQPYVQEAFDTNWVAPLGPNVDAFEAEFAEAVGAGHAVAVSSGTAALHLALRLAGVEAGDEVVVSTFTFSASVNPIVYEHARPVLVDSEAVSWNLDPNLVEDVLRRKAAAGRQVKALVPVHLYGQSAEMVALMEIADRYGVTVIEDAAEALGATCHGRAPGTFGKAGIFSFNGNKIITTSGGGMLVTEDGAMAQHARKLATQARDAAPHYQHSEIGFNYRMSNVLAGIGRGQLRVLEDRVLARRANFAFYQETLSDLPGVGFMPEAPWGRHTRWLSCLTFDPQAFGATREDVRLALDAVTIEARPLWKPMHLQPVFAGYEAVSTGFSEALFEIGLCLPSGSNLTQADLDRTVDVIRRVAGR